jgi:glutamate racemase
VPELAVRRYVEPLIAAGAGVIVLGCTHYPLLQTTIARVAAELAGHDVPIVDSAHATAETVAALVGDGRIVAAERGGAGAALDLLVTDLPASFAVVAGRFLGGAVPDVHQVDVTAA